MTVAGSASARFEPVLATVPTDRLPPGIYGLRGVAAVAVVLFHLGHVRQVAVPAILGFVQAHFAKGV